MNIILIITTISIIIYDYKYKNIPIWLLLLNYGIICIYYINPIFLIFGTIFIFLCKKYEYPIDILYIIIMVYLIIRINNINSYMAIIFTLIFIIFNKDIKLSYMIPLEIGILLQLL